jgi:hypothetical protein
MAFAVRCCIAAGPLLLAPCLPAAAQGAKAPHAGRADPRASLPVRKAGLWEVTVQAHAPSGMGGVKQGPITVRQCTDAKAERVLPFFVLPAAQECSDTKVAKLAGKSGYDVSVACKVHDAAYTMRMQLWGDPQSVYSGTYSIEYPAAPLRNSGPVDFQGRWLGSCKPGQRSGDVVLPNGITVNPVDDSARAREHRH